MKRRKDGERSEGRREGGKGKKAGRKGGREKEEREKWKRIDGDRGWEKSKRLPDVFKYNERRLLLRCVICIWYVLLVN